jgi:hypothetical protein
MHVVPATHQCCVKSGCLADFKTKFVIARYATGRQAGTRGGGGLPEQVGSSCAEQVPPPCTFSLPPINVALNLGA